MGYNLSIDIFRFYHSVSVDIEDVVLSSSDEESSVETGEDDTSEEEGGDNRGDWDINYAWELYS